MDPIVAILGANWGAVGGWSMFIGTVVVILILVARETWVPGRRLKNTERLLNKSVALNKDLSEQNGKLLVANELTADFFRKTTPSRGTSSSLDSSASSGGEL